MASNDTSHLAEKIAKLLEAESQSPDLAALFASVEKLNHRLEKLESAISNGRLTSSEPAVKPHPSHEKFAVLEAVADEVVDGLRKEKTCTFEPNGRPCDHCSMCSSRGF